MTSEGFKGISLKDGLVKQVRNLIDSPKLKGRYKSITDFVTEATRMRLEELQKQYCPQKTEA